MLQQHHVVIDNVGEHVTIDIGSNGWLLGFETALRLAHQMRMAAQAAKKAAGDKSIRFGVAGMLHDAAHPKGPDAGQPFTPGKVYPVGREVTPESQVGAENKDTLVQVQLGNASVGIPHEAAFTLSQWIRLNAKAAQARAGDSRHHSEVVLASPH